MDKGQKRVPAVSKALSSSYATLVSRVVLGGVFLFAGATKIPAPGSLAAAIRSYELGLPEWLVSLSAHALPYLEVLLGLYLLAGLFTKTSAWAT
ncbi:MAG TPA: MauE/DoxX family redox-associated membrane protein, partial [Rubrobacteraceae bacterium]|nr:MauE/DoxX family redox-associated membrane protein [Rubrobacteraceae bacterium]